LLNNLRNIDYREHSKWGTKNIKWTSHFYRPKQLGLLDIKCRASHLPSTIQRVRGMEGYVSTYPVKRAPISENEVY
jgi:hypothetical protein